MPIKAEVQLLECEEPKWQVLRPEKDMQNRFPAHDTTCTSARGAQSQNCSREMYAFRKNRGFPGSKVILNSYLIRSF